MKNAGQKLVIGTRKGHAVYSSIDDSIKDYRKYYLRKKYLPVYNSIPDFVNALKEKNYFEAGIPEYIKGVNHFFNLYFNEKHGE